MPIKISTRKLISKNFDIEKYKSLSQIDLRKWLEIISDRSSVFNDIKKCQRSKEEIPYWFEDVTEEFLRDPMKAISKTDVTMSSYAEMSGDAYRKKLLDIGSVKCLTYIDVWSLASNIERLKHADDAMKQDWHIPSEADKYSQEWRMANFPVFMNSNSKKIEPVGDEKNLQIVVSIAATDEQIIKDFTSWLKNIRSHKNMGPTEKKNFNKKNINEWIEFKLIPYVDLAIWAASRNSVITQSLMANLLFPQSPDDGDIFYDAERIRKSTKRKAEYLMSPICVKALDMQVMLAL